MRVEIHVRPGSSRSSVGGRHDGALVVKVTEPPDAGRATEAAMRAVAKALGVPRRSVKLSHGATSRRKLLEIEAGPAQTPRLEAALARLLGRTQD